MRQQQQSNCSPTPTDQTFQQPHQLAQTHQIPSQYRELTPSRLAIPEFEKVLLQNAQARCDKPLVDISSGRYTSSDNEDQLPQPDNFEVYMRCVTWSRDSHGLFDYESRYINKKNIKTLKPGKVVRLDNDVEFVPSDVPIHLVQPDAKPLLTLQQANGKFYVHNDTLEQESETAEQNKMFVVVRNVKSQPQGEDQPRFCGEYKVNKGDTIKMGRLKFLVKDYRSEVVQANIDSDLHSSPVKKTQRHVQEEGEEYAQEEEVEIDCGVADDSQQIQCKICWCDEQTNENPLLCSCKCDGSVRYIHYQCLKHWLRQKMTLKEEDSCISYTWKQFECEICKTPYPYVFRSQGRKYRLVDVALPQTGNFLWLESLTFEKNSSRMVHVIKPTNGGKSEFKLGRGHESDLRVSDISVSRCHAIIKYDSHTTKRFYLEDNLSKFGTLVLANNGIVELDFEQTKAIQIGRSVISFTVKRTEHQQKVQAQPLFQPKQILKTPSPVKIPTQPQYMPRAQQIPVEKPLQQSSSNNDLQSVEEMLRKQITETNQKISDYLQQSNAQRRGVSGLEPRRLDFNDLQDEETAMIGAHLSQQVQQPLQSDYQQLYQHQEAVSPYQHQQQPSQALSETLARFQTMIKQVEQRFAERDTRPTFQASSYHPVQNQPEDVQDIFDVEEVKVNAYQPQTYEPAQPILSMFEPPAKLTASSISPQKRHFMNAHGVSRAQGDMHASEERSPVKQAIKPMAVDFYRDAPQQARQTNQHQRVGSSGSRQVQSSAHASSNKRDQVSSTQRPSTASRLVNSSHKSAPWRNSEHHQTSVQETGNSYKRNASQKKLGYTPNRSQMQATQSPQRRYNDNTGNTHGSTIQQASPTRQSQTMMSKNMYQTPQRAIPQTQTQQTKRHATLQSSAKDAKTLGQKMRFL